MNIAQIKQAIRIGIPFLAVTPHHEILARYMPFGPVFHWKKNQMTPTPLQGDDLIWWLQAESEEDDPDPAGGKD